MNEGKKYDQDKPRYDLVPWAAMDDVAQVLGYGAKKYGDHNCRMVEGLENRYFAAALRHLSAHRQGERNDPETGISHLAHAMCSLLFLLAHAKEQEK